MTRQSQRGSILIESLVILNISVLALIIHIELIRRIQCEVVLHHAAFLDAHSIALKRTDSKGKSFLKKALSYPARVRTERELSAAGGKVKRYFR